VTVVTETYMLETSDEEVRELLAQAAQGLPAGNS
jgi:hypothetical protein